MAAEKDNNNNRKKGNTNIPSFSDEPSFRKQFPDWSRIYAEMKVEEMPWYLPELDPDLKEALDQYRIKSGSFLDLGTGPGTQAIELSKMGFEVTGVDISPDAITNAQKSKENVTFVQDDILNSRIERQFDYIFDRGCFHVIDVDKRLIYISQVVKLLADEGILFLKCFSDKNTFTGFGPHHISRKLIETLFGIKFTILNIKDSVYQSTSSHVKPTLFVVMKKKN
jgi:SAM-dependent methyltransferase